MILNYFCETCGKQEEHHDLQDFRRIIRLEKQIAILRKAITLLQSEGPFGDTYERLISATDVATNALNECEAI